MSATRRCGEATVFAQHKHVKLWNELGAEESNGAKCPWIISCTGEKPQEANGIIRNGQTSLPCIDWFRQDINHYCRQTLHFLAQPCVKSANLGSLIRS